MLAMFKPHGPFHMGQRSTMVTLSVLALVSVIAIAVLQDYLHAQRNGYPFFVHESLVFKVFWVAFVPVFLWMKRKADAGKLTSAASVCRVLLLASVVHVLLVSALITALSTVVKPQGYGVVKVFTYTLANDLVVILLVYGGFIALLRSFGPGVRGKQEHSTTLTRTGVRNKGALSVKSGTHHVLIAYDNILCVHSATPYVSIRTAGKQYLHSASLKAVLAALDRRFIQVHRSCVVNLNEVTEYHSRLNGDYDVILSDGSAVRLSRNYVKSFKQGFAGSSAQVENSSPQGIEA